MNRFDADIYWWNCDVAVNSFSGVVAGERQFSCQHSIQVYADTRLKKGRRGAIARRPKTGGDRSDRTRA